MIGDATQGGILVSIFQQFLGVTTQKEIAMMEKECDLSTQWLKDTLYLKLNDHAFKLFKDLVDSTIRDTIVNIYGDFSQFTTPIITQSMLRDFESAFQQILPTQYHANQIMIGKPPRLIPDAPLTDEKRQKQQLWDTPCLSSSISNAFEIVTISFGLQLSMLQLCMVALDPIFQSILGIVHHRQH